VATFPKGVPAALVGQVKVMLRVALQGAEELCSIARLPLPKAQIFGWWTRVWKQMPPSIDTRSRHTGFCKEPGLTEPRTVCLESV
jgi:hypothetical protein